MHKLSTWCNDHRNFTLTGTFSGTDRVSNFLARVKSPFSIPAQLADPGGGHGVPLIFRPQWGPKGRKNIFLETPPYLRVWMTAPPLSQSLDPELPPSTLDPLPCVMPLHEEAFLLCGCPSQAIRVFNRPTDAHFWRKYKENSPNLL